MNVSVQQQPKMRRSVPSLLVAAAARTGLAPYGRIQRSIARRLRPVQRQIGDARRGVGSAIATLEKRYLAFATEVEQMSEESSAIVTGADRLVCLANGGENGGSIVGRTLDLLTEPLEYVDSASSRVQKTIDALRGISITTRRLLQSEQELERTMLPMETIQVLFRIESARLPSDIQQMFQALMGDIGAMQRKARHIFAANSHLLESILGRLPKVISHLEDMSRLHHTAADRRTDISGSLAELKTEVQRGSTRHVQLTGMARSLASEISTIVMALQAHDIVSQRLAHVDVALELVEKGLIDVESGPGGDFTRVVAELGGVTAVQFRQLESTREDILRSSLGCQDAVAGVDIRLREIAEEGRLMAEFQSMTAAIDRMAGTLIESMKEVQSMLQSSACSASSARDTLDQISAEAQKLSGEFEEIGSDMRRIALNTEIQAARVGSGTGLDVIAAETEHVANQAMEAGARVGGILDEIRLGFGDAATLLSTLQDEGETHLSELQTQSANLGAELHCLTRESLQLVAQTGRTLETVTAHARRLTMEEMFSEVINQPFDVLVAALARLREELERVSWMVGKQDAIEGSHHLQALYTMKSERQTHDDALHAGPSANAATPTGAPGDDVELF